MKRMISETADFWTQLDGISMLFSYCSDWTPDVRKLWHDPALFYCMSVVYTCMHTFTLIFFQKVGLRRHVLRVVPPLLSSSWSGTVVAVGGGSNSGSIPSSQIHSLMLWLSSASSSTSSSFPWSIIQWQRNLWSSCLLLIWLVWKFHANQFNKLHSHILTFVWPLNSLNSLSSSYLSTQLRW